MKKLFHKSWSLASLLLFVFLFNAGGADLDQTTLTDKLSRVKVHFNNIEEFNKLAENGVVLDENIYEKDLSGGFFLTVYLHESKLKIIKDHGLHYEVIVDDVIKQKLSRSELSQKEKQMITSVGGLKNFNFGSKSYMDGCLTFNEVVAKLDTLRYLYPNLISVKQSLGSTYEGRNIWIVKISDNPNTNEAEPKILYTAMHHANEPQGMMVLMYYICYLLENYNTMPEVKDIVDNRELYFVLVLNPDGYVFNENFLSDPNHQYAEWRKNRRLNVDRTFGVDLNRNYAYRWFFDEVGSSSDTKNDNYRGPYPFSEPETQAIRDLCINKNFDMVINYHAYGNKYIFPWAYQNLYPANFYQYSEMGSKLYQINPYWYGTNYQVLNYYANGEADDWMYGSQNIPAITAEVGGAYWNDLNESDLLNIVQANLNPNLFLARKTPFCKKGILKESESNDNSANADGPLTSLSYVDGNLSTNSDVDWYYFDVNQAGNIYITLQGSDKNWQLFKDPSGSPLTLGSIGTKESVKTATYNISTAGRYYIKVSGLVSYYYLMVTGNLNSNVLYEVESNVYASSSDGLIHSGEVVAGKINSTGDIDWYWFEVSNPGSILIMQNVTNKTWQLYSNYNQPSLITGTSGTYSYNITNAGRYYIKVTGSVGSYDFMVVGSLKNSDRELEYNDNYAASSGPVTNAQMVSGKTNTTSDVDWFYFDVIYPGNSVTITMNGDYKSWSAYKDPAANEIGHGSTAMNSSTSTFNISGTGRYYIRVGGYQTSYYFSITGPIASKSAEEDDINPEPEIISTSGDPLNLGNYPNPFKMETTIKYNLEKAGSVSLTVYDLNGRIISTPIKGQQQDAGINEIQFNGSGLNPGIYFYRIETGSLSEVQKMVIRP
jgi:murein tripeptide amidase MpaA